MPDIKKLMEAAQNASEKAISPTAEEMQRKIKDSTQGAMSRTAEIAARASNLHEAGMPKYKIPLPSKYEYSSPEEINEYNSAQTLLKSLHKYYEDWSSKVDENHQIAIYALLPNGAIITVRNLTQEGFNGIAIEGELNNAQCLLLTHQSSLQFLCVAEKVTEEMPKQQIGFIYQ